MAAARRRSGRGQRDTAGALTGGVELRQRFVQLAAQVCVHGHKRGLLHRVLKHLPNRALQGRPREAEERDRRSGAEP